jgi:putative colanic acid biosynthesis UDP-glucose lipid carrier transferase
MSLVGPRPHAVCMNAEYAVQIDDYLARHKIKPGITGWAQVNDARGETRSIEDMQRRVAYDLAYVDNWSLWLDLQIMLRTASVVLFHKNAY